MTEVLLMVGSLVILGFIGEGLLRLVEGKNRLRLPWWQRSFVAFWVGQGVLLGVVGQIAVGAGHWGWGLLAAVVVGLFFCKFRTVNLMRCFKMGESDCAWPSESSNEQECELPKRGITRKIHLWLWWAAVLGLTGFVMFLGVCDAFGDPIQTSAGLGNWLFKVKVILESGGWPRDYLSYAGDNRHIGYPAGFPLLGAWVSVAMGGLNWYWIQVLPLLLMTGAFFLAASVMRPGLRGWTGLVALAVMFGNWRVISLTGNFYAEPMMFFGVAVVAVVLQEVLQRGYGWGCFFLALGPLAAVKQEGAALLGLMGGILWMLGNRTRFSRKWLAVGTALGFAGWVIPWRIFVWLNGVKDENYSLNRMFSDGSGVRLREAVEAYWAALWDKGEMYGGAWWLFPILVLMALMKREVFSGLLAVVAVAYVAVVTLAMAGSVQADFSWHLGAAERVLFLPSMLLLMAFGVGGQTGIKKQVKTRKL